MAYLNPSPQVKGHTNQLPGLLTRPAANPDPARAPQNIGKTWALDRRLSDEVRRAIVSAYQEGIRQQALADRYEVSLSSIKRLIRASRLWARLSTVHRDRAASTAVDHREGSSPEVAFSSLDRPEVLVILTDIEPQLEVEQGVVAVVPDALILVAPENNARIPDSASLNSR
jgi:hypothetical protein